MKLHINKIIRSIGRYINRRDDLRASSTGSRIVCIFIEIEDRLCGNIILSHRLLPFLSSVRFGKAKTGREWTRSESQTHNKVLTSQLARYSCKEEEIQRRPRQRRRRRQRLFSNADNKMTGVVTPVRALILRKPLARKTIGPPRSLSQYLATAKSHPSSLTRTADAASFALRREIEFFQIRVQAVAICAPLK